MVIQRAIASPRPHETPHMGNVDVPKHESAKVLRVLGFCRLDSYVDFTSSDQKLF